MKRENLQSCAIDTPYTVHVCMVPVLALYCEDVIVRNICAGTGSSRYIVQVNVH